MKKGVIIGIAIAIIIGITAIVVSQGNSDVVSQGNSEDTDEISLSEDVKTEPKSFNVDLNESVGFSESP